MDRRTFFQSLIAGGAPVQRTRKRIKGKHLSDLRLYHGPMIIPAHVAEAVREDPTPHRATGRGTHLVSRYAEADGTVYIFRCQIPTHRGMVGEIVRTSLQRIRVHCWSAATSSSSYPTVEELVQRFSIQPLSDQDSVVTPIQVSYIASWRKE